MASPTIQEESDDDDLSIIQSYSSGDEMGDNEYTINLNDVYKTNKVSISYDMQGSKIEKAVALPEEPPKAKSKLSIKSKRDKFKMKVNSQVVGKEGFLRPMNINIPARNFLKKNRSDNNNNALSEIFL